MTTDVDKTFSLHIYNSQVLYFSLLVSRLPHIYLKQVSSLRNHHDSNKNSNCKYSRGARNFQHYFITQSMYKHRFTLFISLAHETHLNSDPFLVTLRTTEAAVQYTVIGPVCVWVGVFVGLLPL